MYVGLSVARSHKSSPPPGVHVVSGATLGPGAAPVRTTKASSVDTEGDSKLLFVSMIPDRTAVSRRRPALRPDEPPGDRGPENACASTTRADTGSASHSGGLLNTGYVAKVFDSDFHVERQYPVPGIPSRARVSPDGRYGATTMFVRATPTRTGNFSTRTSILDLGRARRSSTSSSSR